LGATAPGKHLQYAEATHTDWIIFVGESEVQEGRFPLKQLSTRTEVKLTAPELVARLHEAGLKLTS
jgi:histidyl-tRNA synthetase